MDLSGLRGMVEQAAVRGKWKAVAKAFFRPGELEILCFYSLDGLTVRQIAERVGRDKSDVAATLRSIRRRIVRAGFNAEPIAPHKRPRMICFSDLDDEECAQVEFLCGSLLGVPKPRIGRAVRRQQIAEDKALERGVVGDP